MAKRELFDGGVPFVRVVPGLEGTDIAAAQDGLLRFVARVPASKQKAWRFHVARDPAYNEPDDGVIRRIGENGQDRKIFLHYRPDLPQLLAARELRLRGWQEAWIASCKNIWIACAASLDALAKELDRTHHGFRFAERTALYRDQHVLRVVTYEQLPGLLADEHSDRSAVTIRLAESHPGFYARAGWEVRPFAAAVPPETHFFAGDQLEHITKGGIRRVWHGADDASGGFAVRTAVVFFGKMFPGKL